MHVLVRKQGRRENTREESALRKTNNILPHTLRAFVITVASFDIILLRQVTFNHCMIFLIFNSTMFSVIYGEDNMTADRANS